MKKSKLLLVLILLISAFFIKDVNAEEMTEGNIFGNYIYGDVKLVDADVSIYKIANVNLEDYFHYDYLDDFKGEAVDYNKISSAALEKHSERLYKIIQGKDIEPLSTTKTDEFGRFSFENIDLGLYLVKVDDLTYNEEVYKSSPTLIFVPEVIDETYNYDVSINMKTEIDKPDDDINNGSNNSNGESNVATPNTYDAIVTYVMLFAVSAIILAVLICYIVVTSKKRANKESDKNNQNE